MFGLMPRWLNDRWPDMGKALAKQTGMPMHLLLSKGQAAARPGWLDLLPEKTAITVAFIGLLVQCASRAHSRGWCSSVDGVLHEVLRKALAGQAFGVEVSLDLACRSTPGLFDEGQHRLEMGVDDGCVVLAPLPSGLSGERAGGMGMPKHCCT